MWTNVVLQQDLLGSEENTENTTPLSMEDNIRFLKTLPFVSPKQRL